MGSNFKVERKIRIVVKCIHWLESVLHTDLNSTKKKKKSNCKKGQHVSRKETNFYYMPERVLKHDTF